MVNRASVESQHVIQPSPSPPPYLGSVRGQHTQNPRPLGRPTPPSHNAPPPPHWGSTGKVRGGGRGKQTTALLTHRHAVNLLSIPLTAFLGCQWWGGHARDATTCLERHRRRCGSPSGLLWFWPRVPRPLSLFSSPIPTV